MAFRWLLLATLVAAAACANLWAPGVVPGVHYLPGSVAVLLMTSLFGTRWGLLAALASVIPVWANGDVVLAGILLLEPLAVGMGLRRRPRDGVFLIDGLFWILLGGPLMWAFTPAVAAPVIPVAELTALYQVLVGLTNALITRLMRTLTPLAEWASEKPPPLSLQGVLYDLTGGVALILTLLLLTLVGRNEFAQLDERNRRALEGHVEAVAQQVAQRLGENATLMNDSQIRVLEEILLSEASRGALDMLYVTAAGQPVASTYAHYRVRERQSLLSLARQWHPETIRLSTAGVLYRPDLMNFEDWRDAHYRMVQPLTVGNQPGILLLEKPVTPMLAYLYRVYLNTLLIGLSALLLGLTIVWWLSRRLIQPLRTLDRVAASLPARLHEQRPLSNWPTSRFREIALLTHSIHDMDRRLRQEFEAAAQANRQLELEVRERRTTEAALAESEGRFRQLAEHMHHVVFWMSSADGQQLLYASPPYEAIWGRDLTSLYADWPWSWLAAIHPKDRAPLARRLKEGTLLSQETTEEYRIARPDGAIRWIRSTSFPVRDAQGVVYRSVGLAEDITEIRAAQDRLWRQQGELSHLARLKVVSEMAAGLAHELNQPLAAIAIYTQTCINLLKSEDPPLGKVMETLDKTSTQSLRAGDIVRRLRSFMTQSTPKPEPADINALIREVMSFLAFDTRQRETQLKLDLDPELPPVMADGIQIQQVLVNLIQNALDALQTAHIAPEDRQLRIRTALQDPHTVLVSVADTGAGIPDEVLERLFQPFVTTKPNGTGLGLWISQSILDLHGGRLSAENLPTGGSEFRFTLPTADNARQRQRPSA